MATTPRGATIIVIIICAPQNMACSSVIGTEIRTARRNTSRVGRKLPRGRPLIRKSGCSARRYHIMSAATMTSANTVPMAAPSTPSPAPGTFSETPAMEISRVGNIRKKLKTMSSTHISTFRRLGTFMLPAHRSMPPPR